MHLDEASQIFTLYFYLKLPEDTSSGSDLILYSFKNKFKGFKTFSRDIAELPSKDVSAKVNYQYGSNNLICMSSSRDSVHGMSPRTTAQYPRYVYYSSFFVKNEELFLGYSTQRSGVKTKLRSIYFNMVDKKDRIIEKVIYFLEKFKGY